MDTDTGDGPRIQHNMETRHEKSLK